jgi:DNA-binding MarR family transcriptional regulator
MEKIAIKPDSFLVKAVDVHSRLPSKDILLLHEASGDIVPLSMILDSLTDEEFENVQVVFEYRKNRDKKLTIDTVLKDIIHIKMLRLIHDRPGITLDEISQEIGEETIIACIDIGLLNSMGLLNIKSENDINHYSLSPKGEQIYEELLAAGKRWANELTRLSDIEESE